VGTSSADSMLSIYKSPCCLVSRPQFDFHVVRESNVVIGKTTTGNSIYRPGNAIDSDLTAMAASDQTNTDKWLTINLDLIIDLFN